MKYTRKDARIHSEVPYVNEEFYTNQFRQEEEIFSKFNKLCTNRSSDRFAIYRSFFVWRFSMFPFNIFSVKWIIKKNFRVSNSELNRISNTFNEFGQTEFGIHFGAINIKFSACFWRFLASNNNVAIAYIRSWNDALLYEVFDGLFWKSQINIIIMINYKRNKPNFLWNMRILWNTSQPYIALYRTAALPYFILYFITWWNFFHSHCWLLLNFDSGRKRTSKEFHFECLHIFEWNFIT